MSEPREAPQVIVNARPVYRIVRGLLVGYLGLFHRFRAEGLDNLPEQGGVLLLSNHQSFLDIPVLAVATPRHVAYVARASLARSRLINLLIRESGSVLIRPNSPDRAAIEGMIAHLHQGDCVGVFPEGTRTRDGSLGVFRAGALLAARRAKVPIVPVAIQGAFEAWPRHRRLPRPRAVRACFGAPIDPRGPDPMGAVRSSIAEMIEDSAARGR